MSCIVCKIVIGILAFSVWIVLIEFCQASSCNISKIQLPESCTISNQILNNFFIKCNSKNKLSINNEYEVNLLCDKNGNLNANLALFNVDGSPFGVWLPERCSVATLTDSVMSVTCQNNHNQTYISRVNLPKSIVKSNIYQVVLGDDEGVLKFLFLPKQCDPTQMTFVDGKTHCVCSDKKGQLVNNVLDVPVDGQGRIMSNILYVLQDSGILKLVQLPTTCNMQTIHYDGESLIIKCQGKNNEEISNNIIFSKDDLSKNYVLLNYKGHLMLYVFPDACLMNSVRYSKSGLNVRCLLSNKTEAPLAFKDNMIDVMGNATLNRCDIKLVNDHLSAQCNLNVIKNLISPSCLSPNLEILDEKLLITCHRDSGASTSVAVNMSCDCLGNPQNLDEIQEAVKKIL